MRIIGLFGAVALLASCGADEPVAPLPVEPGGLGSEGLASLPPDDDDPSYAATDEDRAVGPGLRGQLVPDASRDAILEIAVAEDGAGPEQVGVSSGYPLSEYVNDITGGWCSEFVSWAYWRGGCPFTEQRWGYPWMIGGSTQIRDWFQQHSRFVDRSDPEWDSFVPRAGDYIRYDTDGGGHSGIVRYVEGTNLYTVEGNVNNQVMLRTLRNYKTDYPSIDGFGMLGDEQCLGAGGAATGTGGASSGGSGPTGGMVTTGGVESTGGVTATGGATPTGGVTATGGATPTSGGTAVIDGGAAIGSGGDPGTLPPAGGGVTGSGGSVGSGGLVPLPSATSASTDDTGCACAAPRSVPRSPALSALGLLWVAGMGLRRRARQR